MPRIVCALGLLVAAAALTLSATEPVSADEPKVASFAGNWKLTLPTQRGDIILLIAITEKEGKWAGEVLGTTRDVGAGLTLSKVGVANDVLRFTLNAKEQEVITFEGILHKEKHKLNGSISAGGQPRAATLQPSKLTKLDDTFALARELLEQVEDGPDMFELALDVLGDAGKQKLPIDEVRAIVDRVTKAAGSYGPRWERDIALRLVETLAAQEGLSELAIAQAKRAERLLTEDDTTATRMTVLEGIVRAMNKVGKPDEAKTYQAQIAKLELRDYAEYSKTHPPFKVEAFAGRKAKSNRAALIEVFTEAEDKGSVGPLLAFDGLLKTYQPSDAILIQYHVPFDEPDPLMNEDSIARVRQYAESIKGVPAIFISGKASTVREGKAEDSDKAYKELRKEIEEVLEKAPGVKLELAIAKGEKGGFSAKATVSDLEAPGEKMMLRFVLVEERVRYTAGNGLRYHHMVVRAMPGGTKGFPLTKKAQEESVAIDVDALRESLTTYLNDMTKKGAPFPNPERPLALRNLKLIALVQNDATREILQAVQVDLEAK